MALIYSVSVSVDEAYADEWLSWMRAEHIPSVMATGCFVHYRLHRLLAPLEDPTSVIFNVQYECVDRASYDAYQRDHAARLQGLTRARYGEQVHAFRSLLELL